MLLHTRNIARVKVPKGGRIVATQGILWVTREGDRKDYVMRPGDEFVPGRPVEVVVEALAGPAGFVIQGEAERGPVQGPVLLST